MCNLTMKYQHEEEIAALKAEIERLKKKLLDTQIDRGIKANELQRLVALSCKWAKQGHFFRSRATAWKRCAKRWRGIIRMWPKGLVSAPELEIKLKNLPPSPEDKSALDEKPGSTEP